MKKHDPAGYAAAMGTLLLHGWGIAQSHREALRLFQQAAAAANGRGQTGLGIMYVNGWEVKTDYVAALRLLHMGAAQVRRSHAALRGNVLGS